MGRFMASEVDASKVTPPLTAYCFMTGYIDAISFSAIFVWVGFQTGNFTTLALALARHLERWYELGLDQWYQPGTSSPIIVPQGVTWAQIPAGEAQAACSLLAFIVAIFVFGFIGDRVGTHKRGWLVGGTLLQALLTLGSTLAFLRIERDYVHISGIFAPLSAAHLIGIACLSASLGVQGFMARRLSTQFSTSIVLTAIFVELTTDPTLFQVTRSVPSRDHKWLAVIFLFVGAVCGRLILGQVGIASTLGIAVVIRTLIALSWLFIPSRPHVHLP